eukprot:CAMPEP_0116130100 /NCGR_PEP_ID=MMETSP0329-20121206/8275_1 /TAXON_ID=697910 /ORGANISM="Pseudo-nitzschia arenysensis, Strain B593" /LENGTH=513 /DNA_ID=CAMNT_0003624407 /DNA_START=119 /DNA_END=1659 /DNA_ORIENTATION=+
MEFSDQATSIAASLACMSLGAFVWIYLQSSRSAPSVKKVGELEYPPSPSKYHWLWKHGESMAGDGETSHDHMFLEWMQKLNSKVVSFEVPVMGRMVIPSGSLFPKSPTYSNLKPLIGKKSIVAMEGPEWAHQRKAFNPGFSPDYLRGIVTTIAKKCDRFLEFCEKEDIANNRVTNMLARAIDLTSDVIAQVAFGEDWGVSGMETLVTLRKLTDLIGIAIRNPIRRLDPILNWKISRVSVVLDRDMQNLVRRRIAAVKKDETNAPQKDILSLTLSSVLAANKKDEASQSDVAFSDDDMERMTSQLKTFYFAGHDTTATTIAWAYWLLLLNPESLEKARAEVLEHLGKDWVDAVVKGENYKQIIPEESTTYENLQKCQFLDAISRETLRLYPPASSTRYQANPDATLGKYKTGKAIIHLDFYAIQRDPDIWGEDANDFRPERFLGDEGRKKINSFGFLPFSKGSREYFALLETKIALAALITRYDGSVVDADQEIFTAKITNVPKNGCKVKLARR